MNYTEAIDWLENIPISFDSNYDGYELKLVNIAKCFPAQLLCNSLNFFPEYIIFLEAFSSNGS